MRLPVAMTARAWRTPLGNTIDTAMARLYAGERAARADDTRVAYACSVVAQVPGTPAKNRHAERFLRRMGLYGLEVAREALAASGLVGGPRVGMFVGVGGLRAHWNDMLPALAQQDDTGERTWDRGLRDVHPYWMLKHLSNNVHALASHELALRGEGATFGGGNGGAQALASAARALHDGAVDAALVIAYDSLLEPETLVELGHRRAATHATASPPAPYDSNAAGFVPGEAAAAIMLVRRADSPLALVEAIDGADGTPAEPATATLARAAASLADGAGLIDGAARAWPELDAAERTALGAAFDRETPLTAITSAMGQLGSATALVQAIALAEALRAGTLPPIAGLANPAAGPLHLLDRATPSTTRAAIGLATAAPGLVSAIRVEVP